MIRYTHKLSIQNNNARLGVVPLLVLMTCFGLMGCEQVKTRQYYAQHTDEMNAVLEKCQNEYKKGNVVSGKLAENCQNAQAAVRIVIANQTRQAN